MWCVTALPLLLVVGHAATLGDLSARTLAALDWTGSAGVTVVVTCDNFTGANGSSISSRAATSAAACGDAVWTTHNGTWSIRNGQAASTTTANANATLNVGAVNSSVQVDLSSLTSGRRLAGVVASHDGASTYLAAVLVNGAPDQVELRLYEAGNPTLIATASTTIVAANTLRMSRSGASIKVTLNGTTILSATLTTGQITTLGSGGRAGLFGGQASIRYDNFVVSSP